MTARMCRSNYLRTVQNKSIAFAICGRLNMGGPSLVGGVNDDVVGPSAPGADRLVLSAPGALGIIPDHSGTDSDA